MKLGLGLSLANTKGSVGAGAPILWKISAYGAGLGSSDSEYVWDGTTLFLGNPQYNAINLNYIYKESGFWYMHDFHSNFNSYISSDLITWSQEEAPDPPSAILSYSQSSYIQTIVLGGADADQTGTYTWNGTTFINGKPKYMGPLKTGAPENNYIYYSSGDGVYNLYGFKTSTEEMISLSSSTDLVSNWGLTEGSSEPIVSNIIYTA